MKRQGVVYPCSSEKCLKNSLLKPQMLTSRVSRTFLVPRRLTCALSCTLGASGQKEGSSEMFPAKQKAHRKERE